MIPSALTRLILGFAITVGGPAVAAGPAGTDDGRTAVPVDPLVHSQTTDHFVNGRYDKTGNYIPPHYQAVSKPRFHGYFFNKNEGGDKAQKPQ